MGFTSATSHIKPSEYDSTSGTKIYFSWGKKPETKTEELGWGCGSKQVAYLVKNNMHK